MGVNDPCSRRRPRRSLERCAGELERDPCAADVREDEHQDEQNTVACPSERKATPMSSPSAATHAEAQIVTNKVARGTCSTWMRRVVHRRTSLMMTAAATGYTPHRGCHRVDYGLTVARNVCWPFLICRMTAALMGLRFASNL